MRSTIQSESSRMRCCVTPPSVMIAVDGIPRCSSDDGRATASGGGGGTAILPSTEPRGSGGGGGGGATALLAGVASFGWGGGGARPYGRAPSRAARAAAVEAARQRCWPELRRLAAVGRRDVSRATWGLLLVLASCRTQVTGYRSQVADSRFPVTYVQHATYQDSFTKYASQAR